MLLTCMNHIKASEMILSSASKNRATITIDPLQKPDKIYTLAGHVCFQAHVLFAGLSFAQIQFTELQSKICQKRILDFVMIVLLLSVPLFGGLFFGSALFADKFLRFLTI